MLPDIQIPTNDTIVDDVFHATMLTILVACNGGTECKKGVTPHANSSKLNLQLKVEKYFSKYIKWGENEAVESPSLSNSLSPFFVASTLPFIHF